MKLLIGFGSQQVQHNMPLVCLAMSLNGRMAWAMYCAGRCGHETKEWYLMAPLAKHIGHTACPASFAILW